MKMKGRLVVISDDFSVNTDLRQVTVISTLLCILLIEVINRDISINDAPRNVMHTRNLMIVAEGRS